MTVYNIALVGFGGVNRALAEQLPFDHPPAAVNGATNAVSLNTEWPRRMKAARARGQLGGLTRDQSSVFRSETNES